MGFSSSVVAILEWGKLGRCNASARNKIAVGSSAAIFSLRLNRARFFHSEDSESDVRSAAWRAVDVNFPAMFRFESRFLRCITSATVTGIRHRSKFPGVSHSAAKFLELFVAPPGTEFPLENRGHYGFFRAGTLCWEEHHPGRGSKQLLTFVVAEGTTTKSCFHRCGRCLSTAPSSRARRMVLCAVFWMKGTVSTFLGGSARYCK